MPQSPGAEGSDVFRVRGQMIYMNDCDLMLFLCSPTIGKMEDLLDVQCYLNDVPQHDATKDLVLMHEQFAEDLEDAKRLEVLTEKWAQTLEGIDEEKKKTDR